MAPEPSERPSSQRLGRYALLKLIAAGGMAEIYLARHAGIEGFRKLVVIKRIHQHLALDRRFVQMFFDEARIAARLNHPNVAQIFDLGRADGHPFIAMEYIEGVSLRDIQERAFAKQAPMPWPLVAYTGARACDGLAHAHALQDDGGQPVNLVHRDISPQNILVSFDGSIKLVDFGIARATIRVEQTHSSSRKGKLRYMSPEQVLGLELDRRSDLFSLGIILWELLSNRRLFDGGGELGVLRQITEAPIPPLVQVGGGMPPSLTLAVERALAKEPSERFATAVEMSEALESSLAEVSRPPNARALAEYVGSLWGDEVASIQEEVKRLWATDVAEASVAEDARRATETMTAVDVAASAFTPTGFGERRRNALLWGGVGATVALIAAVAIALATRPGAEQAVAVPQPAPPVASEAPLPPPPPPAAVAAAGTLAVESNPPGARVLLDGTPIGTTPLAPVPVAAGEHEVQVEKSGYRTGKERVLVVAGEPHTMVTALRPSVAPTGYLTLDTDPWSEVFLGDRRLGQTPLVNVKLPAGRQKLRIRPEGKTPAREVEIEIVRGELVRKHLRL